MSNLPAIFRILLHVGLAVTAGVAHAQAQAAPTPAANSAGDDIVNLSPFLVSSTGDSGYQVQRIVTGSRSAKDLKDMASSISVINLEMINDLGATTVHDIFKYGASGVTQNQSFNEDVNIRGFRSGGTLRDGAARSTTKFAPMYDVERVEILKGPGAMLTGLNAGIGGTVNYVSRAPSAKRTAEMELKVTNLGGVRLQANTTGPAFKSDSLAVNYRLTVGGLKSTEAREKPIEFEDQKFVGGAIGLYFGNNNSLIANAYYFVNNDYLYLEDFLDNRAPKDAFTGLTQARLNPYSTVSFAAGRPQDAFWDLPAANANLTFLSRLTDNGNLRVAYYYGWSDDRRRNPRGSTVQANNYTINRQDVRNNNGIENHSFQVDYLHNWKTPAFNLGTSAGADGSLNLTWFHQSVTNMPALDTRQPTFPDDAAYFAKFPTDESYFLLPRPTGVTGGAATRTEQRATSVSYYFQENLTLLKDRLILVGGLRWYRPSQLDTNLVTNTITDAKPNQFRVHKYGVVAKVLPGVSVYWTAAENVFAPAPGRTDKFLQGDQQGELYRPSVGKLQEFGTKFEWNPSERLGLYGTLAYFKMEQTNIRTQGILENGLIGNIQSAQDESNGLEFDVGVRLKYGPGRADVIFSASDGDSAIAADKGKAYVQQANGFAQQKTSALIKYTWSSGALRGLMLGAGVEKQSLRRNVTYKLYHPPVFDAFAGYNWGKHWGVQLNLTNVTDERYVLQVFNGALVQASDTFRSAVTLRYRY